MKSRVRDSSAAETSQAMQRVKVGMTGLASVLVLIGLASAVFNSASKDGSVNAIGASKPDVVANMTDLTVANTSANEPLAELGVAPTVAPDANTAGATAQ